MPTYDYDCATCNSHVIMELNLGTREPTQCYSCRTMDTTQPDYIVVDNGVVTRGTKQPSINRKTTDAFGNPRYKS